MWNHVKKWHWVYTGSFVWITWLLVLIGDLTGHYYLIADQAQHDPIMTLVVLILVTGWLMNLFQDVVDPRKTDLVKSGKCKCEE